MFAISKKYVRGTKAKVIPAIFFVHKTLNVISTTCFNDLQLPFYNKLNFDHFPIIYERLFEN